MFDSLLRWLDPDRDTAGNKYEEIRRKLIRIYARRGCLMAEDLADEAVNRVCRKVAQITDTYTGDPALYFYAVAKNVYHEWVRIKVVATPPPTPGYSENDEARFDCLEECLENLDADDRELITDYFSYEEGTKIAHRKEMSRRLGVTLNALRMRCHRINKILRKCMKDCLKKALEP